MILLIIIAILLLAFLGLTMLLSSIGSTDYGDEWNDED